MSDIDVAASRSRLRLPLVGLLLLGIATVADGQCPDGAPPPCSRGTLVAAARRPNPPLDESAWIVVPFTNVAKAPDVDWLRDASVNLLSLDLSRWSDITVVDDKRVGDLLRELPPTRAAGALTLNDGLAIARRAGAGRLVMGDFVKVGKNLRLVANVIDAGTGSRVRTVQQNTDADSLLASFAPLARGVLAVPPPSGARLGELGTSRVDAYREYLLGLSALNRFALGEARQHLLKALALDSTFALAHFKFAVAIHWDIGNTDSTERAHALLAARLGGSLPPRERALISARVALANGEFERACDAVRRLVVKDSSDVEALYEVGECEYHGGLAVGAAIDSAHGRVRGNWNVAIASFRRVLLLDPTYHPAFEHILDALTTNAFTLCASQRPGCANDPETWTVWVQRSGDSLELHPVRTAPAALEETRRILKDRVALLNKRAAQRIAEEWVAAGPAEARAHYNLANIYWQLGDADAASTEVGFIPANADDYSRVQGLMLRTQIAVVRGRGDEGRSLVDTLARVAPQRTGDLASLDAAFGRLTRLSSLIRRIATRDGWSPERLQYTLDQPRVFLGAPSENAAADERKYWNSLSSDSTCPAGLSRCRTTALLSSLAYGLRIPRDVWPAFVVPPLGFRFGAAEAVASRRREHLVAAVQMLDSISHARVASGGSDAATAVTAADAALMAGDSVGALRIARFFVDSVAPVSWSLAAGFGIGAVTDNIYLRWLLPPRMMLLRAQLAAALGERAEARVWYTKVLALWTGADPELQPVVSNIRAALAALGG